MIRKLAGLLILVVFGTAALFLALALLGVLTHPTSEAWIVGVFLLLILFSAWLAWGGIRLMRRQAKTVIAVPRPPPPPTPSSSDATPGLSVQEPSFPVFRQLEGEALQLKQALQALNREDHPFFIREGGAEQVDLVVDWRLHDAKWKSLIMTDQRAKADYRMLIKFAPARRQVRTLDVSRSSSSGVLGAQISYFRGQRWGINFEMVFGRREDGSFGHIYTSRFNSSVIKAPIGEIIKEHGWKRTGVTFGRL
jgi:hypothetical protein